MMQRILKSDREQRSGSGTISQYSLKCCNRTPNGRFHVALLKRGIWRCIKYLVIIVPPLDDFYRIPPMKKGRMTLN